MNVHWIHSTVECRSPHVIPESPYIQSCSTKLQKIQDFFFPWKIGENAKNAKSPFLDLIPDPDPHQKWMCSSLTYCVIWKSLYEQLFSHNPVWNYTNKQTGGEILAPDGGDLLQRLVAKKKDKTSWSEPNKNQSPNSFLREETQWIFILCQHPQWKWLLGSN